MANAEAQVPVEAEAKTEPPAPAPARESGLSALRREIDRVFQDFDRHFRFPFHRPLLDVEPFLRTEISWAAPAVDLVEKEKEYEITAELPGMDEKNVEISVANGMLTIKGEKREEKEEKKKDYFLSERRYGSFRRSFRLPDGVDAGKIEAAIKNGVLKVTLPKTAEAQKPEKKIEVKSA
jgi:HSP20 family protein